MDSVPTDPLEWNAYADPSAVTAVLASDVPISIVPLDATDDVPVPPDLADRLKADHQAAGADLVYELLVRNPQRLRSDFGQQLWDELAALTLTSPDLASWQDASVTVGADGRLTRDEAGKTIRFAASADRAAVEDGLLEALRRGEPRVTPFTLAGAIDVAFDGTTCSVSGASDQPGVHELRFQGPAGRPSGVGVVGIRSPHTWEEAAALLPELDVEAPPPDWLVAGPVAEDATGTGRPVTTAGPLTENLAGVACFVGTWPDLRYTPGRPIQVGGGAIEPA